MSRHGLLRWYLHPEIKDTCLSVLLFYQQEIPPGSRSGRLKFQGGQVMMITEGQGYTTIDGVKHPWKAGDVLNLPLRANGIIVQHFNADPNNQLFCDIMLYDGQGRTILNVVDFDPGAGAPSYWPSGVTVEFPAGLTRVPAHSASADAASGRVARQR